MARDCDIQAFEARFGKGGRRISVEAPGRVNLIGEHTDYHDGFVLPAAIDRKVRALGRARDDDRVVVHSATFNTEHTFRLAEPMQAQDGWARRSEGIARRVLQVFKQPRGFEAWLDADLPVGGGLSSSAASMAALGTLAAKANELTPEPLAFARMLQKAEHDFAGVNCGIMDQLAVLLGWRGHALLLDCRSLESHHVALPERWALVVLDTGVKHDLASSEYNKRQEECAAVLEKLRAHRAAIRSLRDATTDDLEAVAAKCDPVGVRRCRHVLAENGRVHAAVEALGLADGKALGTLFAASHDSLRDDYQVSCKELDAMVEAARGAPGCVAARMTGGGFGGSTVNLVEREQTAAFTAAVLEGYQRRTGREGKALITGAADGVTSSEI
jgi:galactokinase